jgi:hypothetical protein
MVKISKCYIKLLDMDPPFFRTAYWSGSLDFALFWHASLSAILFHRIHPESRLHFIFEITNQLLVHVYVCYIICTRPTRNMIIEYFICLLITYTNKRRLVLLPIRKLNYCISCISLWRANKLMLYIDSFSVRCETALSSTVAFLVSLTDFVRVRFTLLFQT